MGWGSCLNPEGTTASLFKAEAMDWDRECSLESTGVYKWSRVPIIALPIRNLPEAAQMEDADLDPMLAEVMENGSSGSEPDADGAGEAGEDEHGVMRAFSARGHIQGVADVIDAVVDENPFNGMLDNLEDAVALDQPEPEDVVPIVDPGVDEPADNAEPPPVHGDADGESDGGTSSVSDAGDAHQIDDAPEGHSAGGSGRRGRGVHAIVRWRDVDCRECGSVAGQYKRRVLATTGEALFFRVRGADGIYRDTGPFHRSRKTSVDGGNKRVTKRVALRWIRDHRTCGCRA